VKNRQNADVYQWGMRGNVVKRGKGVTG